MLAGGAKGGPRSPAGNPRVFEVGPFFREAFYPSSLCHQALHQQELRI